MKAPECKPTVRFVSLEPDEKLAKLIQGYKDTVRELAGDQLYLGDPPHLTAYLAAFPADTRLIDRLRIPFANTPPPQVAIVGWKVFEKDQLTGLNTLVCEIAERDKETLRTWQASIVNSIASLRDITATEARYAARWQYLTSVEQDNVRAHGYPYTGSIWQPHLTIASIRSADWEKVFRALQATPPGGRFQLTEIKEYELIDNHPVARGELVLREN